MSRPRFSGFSFRFRGVGFGVKIFHTNCDENFLFRFCNFHSNRLKPLVVMDFSTFENTLPLVRAGPGLGGLGLGFA